MPGEDQFALDLVLPVDRAGGRLHRQIEQALRDAIRAGRLVAGTALPSTRALARELGISRGVVTEAYGQLVAEGYLVARQGAPTRVADATAPSAGGARARRPAAPVCRRTISTRAAAISPPSRATSGSRRRGAPCSGCPTTCSASPTRAGSPSCATP